MGHEINPTGSSLGWKSILVPLTSEVVLLMVYKSVDCRKRFAKTDNVLPVMSLGFNSLIASRTALIAIGLDLMQIHNGD